VLLVLLCVAVVVIGGRIDACVVYCVCIGVVVGYVFVIVYHITNNGFAGVVVTCCW